VNNGSKSSRQGFVTRAEKQLAHRSRRSTSRCQTRPSFLCIWANSALKIAYKRFTQLMKPLVSQPMLHQCLPFLGMAIEKVRIIKQTGTMNSPSRA
jgi:hypothetical protein